MSRYARPSGGIDGLPAYEPVVDNMPGTELDKLPAVPDPPAFLTDRLGAYVASLDNYIDIARKCGDRQAWLAGLKIAFDLEERLRKRQGGSADPERDTGDDNPAAEAEMAGKTPEQLRAVMGGKR